MVAGLMVPIGVAMVWGAYTVGLWGYCLVRGYDVTFMQLFKGQWPAGSSSSKGTSSGSGGGGSSSKGTGNPPATRPEFPSGPGSRL